MRSVIVEAIHDNLAGEAAKMAYYFFLSVFPFAVAVFAVTGMVGGDRTSGWIARAVGALGPTSAQQFIPTLTREVTAQSRLGLLSIGILLALWAASSGIAALTSGLNAIYDVHEGRSWLKRRLIALAVLSASSALVVLAAAALVPSMVFVSREGLGAACSIARWPLAFVLMTGAIWLGYYYLPARDQRHARAPTLVGALTTTTLWALATWLLKVYVSTFGRYGRVYGALGAVIALLVWFYMSAFVVLVGGELGAQLEHRARDPTDARSRPNQRALVFALGTTAGERGERRRRERKAGAEPKQVLSEQPRAR